MANQLLEQQQERASFVESLNLQKKTLRDEADAIHKAAMAGPRAMTAEELAKFNANLAQIEGINATIETTSKFSNIPNDGGRSGANTEIHNNAEDKPWGWAAKANETKAERKERLICGFGEFLTAVRHGSLNRISGKEIDPRLMALNSGYEKRAAAAGSSEAVPSDGGFLIAPDFSNEILMLIHETGLVYPRTRKLPLSEFTNAIKIPAVDEQSRKDGSRWGGVQAFWEQEAQAFTGSKPTISLLEMITKKLTGLYYATNEVLADSRLLGSVVMQAFSEEMSFKLDDGVIRGTGAGQLLGLLNSPALITVAKESGQATQTILPANIAKMWGRLWNRSRMNSVWLVNQDTEPQLNQLNVQGASGGIIPVYYPPGAGVFGSLAGAPLVGTDNATGGSSGMLYGRPVIAIEQAASIGTPGDIILCDLNQYLMIDKGAMQTASSQHVRFLTDEMTYRWVMRVDGAPWWKVPIQPAQGTNTLSPFIVLAQR
jgi:HK97 family phage major capsid protein